MSKVKRKDLRKQIRHLEDENFDLAVGVIELVAAVFEILHDTIIDNDCW
jgi:hypothetical protein